MGMKYVRNTDDATIVCKHPLNKAVSFIFPPKKVDKRNSVLISNGFTEISEEDLALLRAENNTFKYYESKGKLTIGDTLPQEAMSPEQLISSLRNEIALLKEKLGSQDSSGKTADLKNAVAEARSKIAEQEKALEEANATITRKERMIEALDEQLAAMVEGEKSDENNQSGAN